MDSLRFRRLGSRPCRCQADYGQHGQTRYFDKQLCQGHYDLPGNGLWRGPPYGSGKIGPWPTQNTFDALKHLNQNHMGHVILTSHLLPLLKKTAEQGHKVRISNQSSNAHEQVPKDIKFASLDELNTDLGKSQKCNVKATERIRLGAMAGYGRSKLAGILYSKYLNKHLTSKYPNILVNATHPGFVKTTMSEEDIHEPFPIAGYGMSELMTPFKKE